MNPKVRSIKRYVYNRDEFSHKCKLNNPIETKKHVWNCYGYYTWEPVTIVELEVKKVIGGLYLYELLAIDDKGESYVIDGWNHLYYGIDRLIEKDLRQNDDYKKYSACWLEVYEW